MVKRKAQEKKWYDVLHLFVAFVSPDPNGQRIYRSTYMSQMKKGSTETYDTSGFNDTYSNESEDDDDDNEEDEDADDKVDPLPRKPSATAATMANTSSANSTRFTPYDIDQPSGGSKPVSATTRGSRLAKYQVNHTSGQDDDGDDEGDSGISSKNSSQPNLPPNSSVDENGFIVNKAEMERRQRSGR